MGGSVGRPAIVSFGAAAFVNGTAQTALSPPPIPTDDEEIHFRSAPPFPPSRLCGKIAAATTTIAPHALLAFPLQPETKEGN